MDFKKKLVELKQEEEMDAREKEEAAKEGKKKGKKGDEHEQSFEEKRKVLLKEAEEGVAKIKLKEKAELAEVAAKMKADASRRKQMRKAGAPSTKNIDKSHFIEKCGARIDVLCTSGISCASSAMCSAALSKSYWHSYAPSKRRMIDTGVPFLLCSLETGMGLS